jgi:hypothetical protein
MSRSVLASLAALSLAGVLTLSAGPAVAGLFGPGAPPPPGDLWRGHFSGGRNLAPGATRIALDWAEDTQFFPSDLACRQWLRSMHAAYPTYEGFHGCLRIR